MMAGLILVALGISRMGRLIQFVPYPVVLGFTAGIAVVIAVMQIPDFLGLQAGDSGEHFVDNVIRIAQSFDTLQPWEMAVGLFTLAVMLVWPRMHTPVPAPLTGLIVGRLWKLSLHDSVGSFREQVAWVFRRWRQPSCCPGRCLVPTDCRWR